MTRRFAAVFLLIAGLAFAGELKEITGAVKSVTAETFVVADSAGKESTFAVDKETLIVAKGASHKMDKLNAQGKLPVIGEFLKEKQTVVVKYAEKDGKLIAKQVQVK